jgi:hypothetical protein
VSMLYQRGHAYPAHAARMEALEEVISGFVQLARQVVPASNVRDETLLQIEGLRDILSMMLSCSES